MIIKNCKLVSLITFGFAKGITIYPFVLFKSEPSETDLIHEQIHLKQQKELFVLFFYIWYLVEFLLKGYYGISFEKEAYHNETNTSYLTSRRIFSFINYL